jgi:hypothetical protein
MQECVRVASEIFTDRLCYQIFRFPFSQLHSSLNVDRIDVHRLISVILNFS